MKTTNKEVTCKCGAKYAVKIDYSRIPTFNTKERAACAICNERLVEEYCLDITAERLA